MGIFQCFVYLGSEGLGWRAAGPLPPSFGPPMPNRTGMTTAAKAPKGRDRAI